MSLRNLCVLALAIAGCQTAPPKATNQTPTEAVAQAPIETVPQTPPPEAIRMALVLGPGAFKTFAYPGFLKTLTQNGVIPKAIVGLEWGSLSAAAYALNGRAHEAEWKVFKLEEAQIKSGGLLNRHSEVKVSQLREYLKENLGLRSEADTKIAFQCPILRLYSGQTLRWSNGPLWQKVEACLAAPNRFAPTSNDVPQVLGLAELAQSLRTEGYNVIVFVSVLGDLNQQQLGTADWMTSQYWTQVKHEIQVNQTLFNDVIRIDTQTYPLFDFAAKKGLSPAGEKAGLDAARELVRKYRL
jgi:hypothetical protein